MIRATIAEARVFESWHAYQTWRLITASLMRGSPTDEISDEEVTTLRTIWGLLDHDLPHAGELSLLLGACGLPGVEID